MSDFMLLTLPQTKRQVQGISRPLTSIRDALACGEHYCPLGRWKEEQFKDGPWHHIREEKK